MSRQSIAAIAALLVLAGCEGGSAPIPTAPDVWVPPDPVVHTVRVLDNAFEPKNLQIAPGDTVRWVLEGRSRHSISDGSFLELFEAYLEKPGDSFEYQFRHSGFASYWCKDHAGEGMGGCIGVGRPPRCGWN